MSFTFSFYYTPLIIAVGLSLLTSFYAAQYRERTDGKVLLILSFSIVWWSFINILEYGFNDLAIKSLCAKLEYFGIEFAPPTWMIFVAIYTDQWKWLTRRNLLLLLIIPVITIVMVFTNEYHGLMRYDVALDTNGPFSIITKKYGFWFWIATVFNNCIMLTGLILIFRRLTRRPFFQTKQLVIMLFVGLFPWLGNILYLSKIFAWLRVDLTSTFLAISGVVMTFGMARYHLLSVVPLAREFVLENISDAIMVVDGLNRVVDFNDSCRKLFGLDEKNILKPLEEILEPLNAHLDEINSSETFSNEITFGKKSNPRTYYLRVHKLYSQRQKLRGRIFHFHDITERKAAEHEREKIIAELKNALEKVDTLSGYLPICSSCKKIRDDQGYWEEVEKYISSHSKAQFSHTLCNECMQRLYPEEYERIMKRRTGKKK